MKKVLLAIYCLSTLAAFSQTLTTIVGKPGTTGSSSTTDDISTTLLNEPAGICIDTAGRLFFTEVQGHRIKYVDFAGGKVYIRSGSTGGYLNAAGGASRYAEPFGIACDMQGFFYIADQYNQCIRKLDRYTSTGNSQGASTLAGPDPGPGASPAGYANGQGNAVRFDYPIDVAVDTSGIIYVLELNNSCVRKLLADGTVSHIAGGTDPSETGYVDGAGNTARFDWPMALEVFDSKTLLVADAYNSCIRKIDLNTNTVSTFAGKGGSADGIDGTIANARFHFPTGLAVDFKGNVFVSDGFNERANTIRMISNGQVKTIAGKYEDAGSVDGKDTVTRLRNPAHITMNKERNALYIADQKNHTIRKLDLTPSANFVAAFTTAPKDTEIEFTSFSIMSASSYQWEVTPNTVTFTPGYGPTTPNPRIKFNADGKYTIKLTATNQYGNGVETKADYITIGNTGGKPFANFTASKTVAGVGETITLADQSTNNPTTWKWEITPNTVLFIGGTNANSQNPAIQFTAVGQYSIKLTSTNAQGDGVLEKPNYINVWAAGIEQPGALAVKTFPNPVTNELNIEIENAYNSVRIALFDITGKLVYEYTPLKVSDVVTVDMANEKAGVYFLTIDDNGTKSIQKVVKQ